MTPDVISTNRNKQTANEDLPDPVLPTIPIRLRVHEDMQYNKLEKVFNYSCYLFSPLIKFQKKRPLSRKEDVADIAFSRVKKKFPPFEASHLATVISQLESNPLL